MFTAAEANDVAMQWLVPFVFTCFKLSRQTVFFKYVSNNVDVRLSYRRAALAQERVAELWSLDAVYGVASPLTALTAQVQFNIFKHTSWHKHREIYTTLRIQNFIQLTDRAVPRYLSRRCCATAARRP